MRKLVAQSVERLEQDIDTLMNAGEKNTGDVDKRAAMNAAGALGEAAAQLREIGQELDLAARDEHLAPERTHRMVGIYALRDSPDFVVFDTELDTPRTRTIGKKEDFDCLGSLRLELHPDREPAAIRRVLDTWSTRPLANPPPSAQDCAIELSARRHETAAG